MAYFGGELSSQRNFSITEPKNVEIYMALFFPFSWCILQLLGYALCIMHYECIFPAYHRCSQPKPMHYKMYSLLAHALWANQLYSHSQGVCRKNMLALDCIVVSIPAQFTMGLLFSSQRQPTQGCSHVVLCNTDAGKNICRYQAGEVVQQTAMQRTVQGTMPFNRAWGDTTVQRSPR